MKTLGNMNIDCTPHTALHLAEDIMKLEVSFTYMDDTQFGLPVMINPINALEHYANKATFDSRFST